MHDRMYESGGALSREDLIGYAAELGLDSERIAAELDSGAHAPRVQRDVDSGARQRRHRHARRSSSADALYSGSFDAQSPDRGARDLRAALRLSSGSRPGRSPGRPPPRRARAGRHRAARRAPMAVSGITVPSSRRCSPVTEIVLRRSRRTGVERRRCTLMRPKQPTATRTPATTVFAEPNERVFTHHEVSAGKARPGDGEPEVGVEPPAEELQVVGDDDEAARDHERHEGRGDDDAAGDPDPDRSRQRADRERDQRPIGELGAQWASVELVERVGADPHRQEEGGERHRRSGRCGSRSPPRRQRRRWTGARPCTAGGAP